jgi:ATP-dependent RNA circularization protein (DNA/RNA ligase family)
MNDCVKYPKTFHLPWSPGLQNDDRLIPSLSHLESLTDVVVSEKLDGENTSIYKNKCHARSIDSKNHPSRNWLKSFITKFQWQMPEYMRICGENVYAKHSIYYDKLTTYFYVFAIFIKIETSDICLSWDETLDICKKYGLETVPVLYRGQYDEKKIKSLYIGKSVFGEEQEGYVIRNSAKFITDDFGQNVAKYVRKDHIQTDEHWAQNWIKNELAQHPY